MQIQILRDGEALELNDRNIKLIIGPTTYRLNESITGGLTINKDADRSQMAIHPGVSNEITIF